MILSVLATLAVPAYFDRHEITLEKAAVLLARDLRAAQNRAAIWREPLTFQFERAGYRVLHEDGSVADGPLGRPFVRDYARDAVFEDVWVEHASFGDDAVLLFRDDGEAAEAGDVVLERNGHRRHLRVRRRTGHVSILDSTSGFRDRR